ncbi:MAG: hypothetical protein JWQ10_3437 [Herbaspirillum sp.]|jgi:hypothetical protein|nr:hypothetical protein [Herbaspirillum sp.]
MKNYHFANRVCKLVVTTAFIAGAFVSTPAFSQQSCKELYEIATQTSDFFHKLWNSCLQSGYSFNVCYESTSMWREGANRANQRAIACTGD